MKLRWFFSIAAQELRQALAYRVDFWALFLGSTLTSLVVAYFLWSAIFSLQNVDQVEGYTFPMLMLYYLWSPMVERLVRGNDNFELSADIYNGSLNKYLIYPTPYFGYRYSQFLARSLISFLQFLLATSVYLLIFGVPAGLSLSAGNFALAFLMIWLAGLCNFFFAAAIEMVAFWADNAWSLIVLFRFACDFFGGALLPLEIFPTWAGNFLNWTYFAYVVNFPIRILMGKVTSPEILHGFLVLSVWTTLGYLTCRLVWERGRRQYTGVGV